MTRLFTRALLFLALAVLQTSFFSSLPGVLAYMPLVLAAGIYVIQHVGSRTGVWWIVSFGLFLDVLSIASFPLETCAYAAAAAAAVLSARHLFSNRSWYGLIACGASSVAAQSVARALILAAIALRTPEAVSWAAFFDTVLWSTLLLAVLLSLFFAFAKQIRTFLRTTVVATSERDTL